jgi:carboxymethylenebutenolidase
MTMLRAQMIKRHLFFFALLVLTDLLAIAAGAQTSHQPQTVEVHSGSLTLRALLWCPPGKGPFPAVLLNHGSGRSREELGRLGPYEQQADTLGSVFARHGYVFLYLFRRGVGLSANQGANAVDLMNAEFAALGQDARNALQLRLLENEEMADARAGLAFLRALPEVDTHNIAAVGHSFGGSLTLLLAEREPTLRAIVIFSGAGYSWDRSPPLRTRLVEAVRHISAPIFFIHAANDFSLSAGKALDAQLAQLGKPHRLKIYPPVGQTAEEGHSFLYLGVNTWELDVFDFLDEYTRR